MAVVGGDSENLTTTAMSAPFYEFQLFVLATFCVAAVAFERRANGDSDAPSSSHSRSDSTTTISGIENGNAQSTSKPGASSIAALARNYLIVYGIVMCEHSSICCGLQSCAVDTDVDL